MHSDGWFFIIFSPSQHGTATPGGAEILFHHISFLMETNPSLSILSTDVKNSFNSVSRDSILSETKLNFQFFGDAKQMYESSSTLIYTKDRKVVKLLSEEGVLFDSTQ